MGKEVVFIGGIHGVGKSTICQLLTANFGWKVVKQRGLLIEVGKEQGLEWPEVARKHDVLIYKAAERLVQMIQQNEQDVLFVDCHYAIPASAAIRPHAINNGYIPNLDWRLVRRVKQTHRCRFVLLEINPVLALERIGNRPEAAHYENTLGHFVEEAKAEKEMFFHLLRYFSVKSQDFTCLDATHFKQTLLQVISFVQSV